MPLIIEDEGKLLGKKQAKVPDKLVDKIKNNLNLFGQYKKSKGYKRASSIVDDDYNKRSNKKDKIKNGDKTLSFSDIKKIDHEYKDMSINDADANEKNLGFILPGGNDMKNWAHDTLRKMRTAVKKVDAVPPVPKLEKNPTKVKDVNKDIKMGNATVRITESQLLILKEYHDQLSFNFDKDGNGYFKKDNWEHYVDFLEDIGKPGMLPKSQWTKREISTAIEKAKERVDYQNGDITDEDYLEAFLELVYETFIYGHFKKEDIFEENFLELFYDYDEYKEKNNYYGEDETLRRFLTDTTDVLDNPNNLDDYLTVIGYRQLENNLREEFVNKFEEYDMFSSMIINERGLVYIERNIKIPKFNSPNFSYNNEKNYYNYLKKMYYDLGYCFSWGEGHGEAYCGSSFGVEGSSEIKLKCWVDPKDINWEETVYRNCYSLREEREVYISSSGAKIEVFDVVLENGESNGIRVSGKSLMKTPIIIEY